MNIKIPRQIELKIHIEKDGGFWAEFPQLTGCYTQGDDLSQLPKQVEDALLTYFDVPKAQAKRLTGTIDLSAQGKVDLMPA